MKYYKVSLMTATVVMTIVLSSCAEIPQSKGMLADNNKLISLGTAEEIALKVANTLKFFNITKNGGVIQTSKDKRTWQIREVVTINNFEGTPGIYAINLDPTGFVLISANLGKHPVLAFSETQSFYQDIGHRGGLTQWVNMQTEKVHPREVDKSEIAMKKMQKLWGYFLDKANRNSDRYTTRAEIGPLIYSEWGQVADYNISNELEHCDYKEKYNHHAPAGCVAVAVGQVMRKWEYDDQLRFKWDDMPLRGNSTNAKVGKNIAPLLYDIGKRLSMNYTCQSASARMNKVEGVLESYGYSPTMDYVGFSDSVIVNELVEGRPLIMRGAKEGGGSHAWVVAGYKKLQYTAAASVDTSKMEVGSLNHVNYAYYMNWGWEGKSNGYYYYGDFKEFNNNNKLLIGIEIPASKENM